MNDTVHVQVQVVELHAIWIRFGDIDGFAGGGFFLHHIGNGEWIAVGEPTVKGWDSHVFGPARLDPVQKRRCERKRKK